jgi:His/Glu/Gln/Arg/opine family amino acid ABC transporter permease subunit
VLSDTIVTLLRAGIITLEIAGGAWCVATVLGLAVSLIREVSPRPVRALVDFILTCIRGIPQLVVLYLLFFGLGGVGVNLSSLVAAILGLGLVETAFAAECFRGSLLTVRPGQRDAAHTLGLTWPQSMRFVVLPQCVPFLIPSLLNVFVGLLKLASIASAVGVSEILYKSQAIMNQDYQQGSLSILQVSLVVIILYLVFTVPLTKAVGRLETGLRAKPSGGQG